MEEDDKSNCSLVKNQFWIVTDGKEKVGNVIAMVLDLK
jgi:hypothetical protein